MQGTYIGARPEAKLSKAKRTQSSNRIIVLSLLSCGSKANLLGGFFGVPLPFSKGAVSVALVESVVFSASHCWLSSRLSSSLATPIAAYTKNTNLYASTVVQPLRSIKSVVIQPQVTRPSAVPAVPISAYQAKIEERSSGGVK